MTNHTQLGDLQVILVHQQGFAECCQVTNKHDLNKIVEDAAAGRAKYHEDRPALGNCQFVQGRSSQLHLPASGLHGKIKDLTLNSYQQ